MRVSHGRTIVWQGDIVVTTAPRTLHHTAGCASDATHDVLAVRGIERTLLVGRVARVSS